MKEVLTKNKKTKTKTRKGFASLDEISPCMSYANENKICILLYHSFRGIAQLSQTAESGIEKWHDN